MQSAKELMGEITKIVCAAVVHAGDIEYAERADSEIEALIRARDREIIEEFLTLIFSKASPVFGDITGDELIDAKDEFLRDLG